MLRKVVRMLEGVDGRTRESVIRSLELRLGHSLEESAEYERDFIERELRMLLWIEGDESSQVAQNGNGVSSQATEEAELSLCPSCGEKGLLFENGCSRCVFCGFAKCDV